MWFGSQQAKPNLPPGIKKGDPSGIIMLSKIWWNSEGKISRELEYGKLLWEGFDINAFYEFWEDQAYEFPDGLLRNRLGTDRLLEETW